MCHGCFGYSTAEEPPQQLPPPPQHDVLVNHPCLVFGPTFEWEEIFNGSNHFQESNLLGQGNFGRVYRCDLPRLNAVGAAKIKKLVIDSDAREFEVEIRTLHVVNHPNVIRVLGKFFGRESICVVYEFMPNGSLDHHLFGRGQEEFPCLEWNRRVSIALGVVEALVYLHERVTVIHRDVKSSNVLLDENFVPKLTDFGLTTAINVGEDGFERGTTITPNVRRSRGFVAPETPLYGLVSTKSDVYSFGILLLELITGKKAYDTNRRRRNITDWLRSVRFSEDDLSQVIDEKLGNRYSVQGLQIMFEAATMCIGSPASRPDMDLLEQMVYQAAAYNDDF